jgi:pimeloyl-ACP methyl ester carboxylesterase
MTMTERSTLPLLLLPGLTNDERVWRPVMTRLAGVADARFVELTASDTMAGLAAAVLAGAPERFAVAGVSMGGYCALELFRQAPGRVLGMALVDTSARPDTAEGRAAREQQIARAETDFAGVVAELVVKWVHPTRLHDADVGEVARDMALDAGPARFARQQRAIMSRADSRPLLASIACPCVVVAGDADAVMPREIHEELAHGIAGAHLVMLPGAGHLAPLEAPGGVADALRGWLARL